MKRNLKVLAKEWNGCTRCALHKDRPSSDIVFSWGRGSARYMIIYDAPTASDEQAGTPMAGEEGESLTELLEDADISFDDVFITPLVGCRPTTLIPATGDKEAFYMDRSPTKEEILACQPRITELIYRVDPALIFTLGAEAWRALVPAKSRGRATTLDKAVGELFEAPIPGRFLPTIPFAVMPLFSMQQLITAPSSAAHGPRATTIKLLRKGKGYADWLYRTMQRDNEAAGYGDEADSAGAPTRTRAKGAP